VLLPEGFEFHQRNDAGPASLFTTHVKDLGVDVDAFFLFFSQNPLADPRFEQTVDSLEVAFAFLYLRIIPQNQSHEIVRGKVEESLLMLLADDVIRRADELGNVSGSIPVTLERLDCNHSVDLGPDDEKANR
jgi:hypothetical protein